VAAAKQKHNRKDAGLTQEEEKALEDIKTGKVKTMRYTGQEYLKRIAAMANESSE
jgi:hypothetical protein